MPNKSLQLSAWLARISHSEGRLSLELVVG